MTTREYFGWQNIRPETAAATRLLKAISVGSVPKDLRDLEPMLREILRDYYAPLLDVLENFVKHNAASAAHAGSCGPETTCDTDCQAAYFDSMLLSVIREELAALRK